MNKKAKKSLVFIILLSIALILLVGAAIFYIVYKVNNGWTINDTLSLIFDIFVTVSGFFSSLSFLNYFSHQGKDFVVLNNRIYETFNHLENSLKIDSLKQIYVTEYQDKLLLKMNKIYQKKYPEITITKTNISEYFSDETFLIKDLESNFNLVEELSLENKAKKIFSETSPEYEELYRQIKSGELLNKPKFPLIETILPFILGFVGLFETVYQTLSINEEIGEPLTNYLLCFGAVIFFSFSLALCHSISFKESFIKEKQKTLNKLKSLE